MPEQWSIRCLSHFTLAVRNLERSIEFYSKVGFQMIHDRRNVNLARHGGRELRHARRPQGEAC